MDIKRNLKIVSEENARLKIRLCNLSGLDWYVRGKDGKYYLIISIDEGAPREAKRDEDFITI